jgi:hypothetical protein
MKSAIDAYMPQFDVRERHKVIVNAPADAVHAAVRSVDLSNSPLISWLFRLRELPGGLSGRSGRRLRLNIDGLLCAVAKRQSDRSYEAQRPARARLPRTSQSAWQAQPPCASVAEFGRGPAVASLSLATSTGRIWHRVCLIEN